MQSILTMGLGAPEETKVPRGPKGVYSFYAGLCNVGVRVIGIYGTIAIGVDDMTKRLLHITMTIL